MRAMLEPLAGARFRVGLGGSNDKYILVLAGETARPWPPMPPGRARAARPAGIGQVTSSSSLQRPELVVKPDAARAADLGVSTAAIGDALRMATSGDYEQFIAQAQPSQRQVPINVRLPDSARQDLDLLGQLHVQGTKGPVPPRRWRS